MKAAESRGWSRDATAQAVRNLKDDRVPDRHKRQILEGGADPVVVTPEGQMAVAPDVIGKQIREMEANDAVLALERSLEALAKLRLFRPEAIMETMGEPRRARLIDEMPGYIEFLETILRKAKNTKKLKVVS